MKRSSDVAFSDAVKKVQTERGSRAPPPLQGLGKRADRPGHGRSLREARIAELEAENARLRAKT